MNRLKKIILVGLISSLASVMVACGDNPDETKSKNAKGDHVWKTQTDTLQSAKDMSKKMQESLNQQQETMDENN